MKVLAKERAKKAARVGILGSEMPLMYPSSSIDEPVAPIMDWSSIPPISLFSPRLFADLGIPDIIETFPDIRSNF